MCAECMCSVRFEDLHEDCRIQQFNFCTDPVGNSHSFTAIYTQSDNVVLYTARAAYANSPLPHIIGRTLYMYSV